MKRIALRGWTGFSLALTMIVPAQAAPGPTSISVRFEASDFASDSAAEQLKARLKSAARSVCKYEYRGDDYRFIRACEAAAMQDALVQIDEIRTRLLVTSGAATIVVPAR